MKDINTKILESMIKNYQESDSDITNVINEDSIKKLWDIMIKDTQIVSNDMMRDGQLDRWAPVTQKIQTLIAEIAEKQSKNTE